MIPKILEDMVNSIRVASLDEVARIIFKMLKAMTPQFYRNISEQAVQDELLGISLMIGHIDNDTIAEMCIRAIENYSVSKSNGDNKVVFNIDYILSYFCEAFDYVHSDCVPLSKKAVEIKSEYDEVSNIKTQTWLDNGKEVVTASMTFTGDCGGRYSKKDFELMFTDLDSLDFGLSEENEECKCDKNKCVDDKNVDDKNVVENKVIDNNIIENKLHKIILLKNV